MSKHSACLKGRGGGRGGACWHGVFTNSFSFTQTHTHTLSHIHVCCSWVMLVFIPQWVGDLAVVRVAQGHCGLTWRQTQTRRRRQRQTGRQALQSRGRPNSSDRSGLPRHGLSINTHGNNTSSTGHPCTSCLDGLTRTGGELGAGGGMRGDGGGGVSYEVIQISGNERSERS